jgi:hypothetical protein
MGENWPMADIGNSKPIQFSKTFYTLENNLNSIQIRISNDSSCKIKYNNTHRYKIKLCNDMKCIKEFYKS